MKKHVQSIYNSVTLSLLIWLLSGLVFNPSAGYGKDLLGIILLGGIIGIGGLLYEKLQPLLLALIIHLILSLLTFWSLAYFLNMFPWRWEIVVTSSLIFIFIFLVIWTINYWLMKRQITHINKKIQS
ncbi:DUF3021 family protein [Hutsoniella sourekii]